MIEKEGLTLSDLNIREMVNQDLNEVLVIERNAQLSPWSRLSFEESLTRSEKTSELDDRKPSANSDKKPSANSDQKPSIPPYCCRVVETVNAILAYYVVSAVADELHVLNVVVATNVQGLGLGHVLIQDIDQFARAQGLNKIFLEVRASNEIAQGLYRKWQFKQIAVRKGYYSAVPLPNLEGARSNRSDSLSRREDALVFMRKL